MRPAPFFGLPPGGLAPAAAFWLTTPDGYRLRAAFWPATVPRGHVVMLNGRTEFVEKGSVPAAELVARGYSVISLDWRGQGLSDRALDEPLKGHVADFSEYQTDLDTLLASPLVRDLPGPRLVLAHSMGGTILLGALARGLEAHAAILSAPMLGIAMSGPMRIVAVLTIWLGRRMRKAENWPPFGDVRTPYVLTGFEDNVLTGDRAIWDWMATTLRDHPELQLGFPTLGWFQAANREMKRLAALPAPACPLLYLLGTEEKVVSAPALRASAARLGAELAVLDGARHEPLVESTPQRRDSWAAIDRFLHGL